jgi:uncharacterized protein with HEPN domain
MSFMPSKSPFNALCDIRDHINLARSFVEGFTFDSFVQDRRTVYAVTRCLEIISEASRRLPSELKARHPKISWKKVAAAGNIYRHDYEEVFDSFIWSTVQESLESLRVMVADELEALNK